MDGNMTTETKPAAYEPRNKYTKLAATRLRRIADWLEEHHYHCEVDGIAVVCVTDKREESA